MNELEICKMSKNDIDRILLLNNLLSSKSWKHDDYLAMLSSPTQNCIVAKINTSIVGFLAFNIIFDEIEILQIVVDLNIQRNNIGTALIKYLYKLASQYNVKKIYLEVASNNITAIAFYDKLGFKDLYIRKNYYSDGDHAVIKEIVFNEATC